MAKLAAGRRDLVPIYSAWGWNVGHPNAGVAVALGPDPVVLAEEPATRVAWTTLDPRVHQSRSLVPGTPVVAGVFDWRSHNCAPRPQSGQSSRGEIPLGDTLVPGIDGGGTTVELRGVGRLVVMPLPGSARIWSA
jgi:hypothetical protein